MIKIVKGETPKILSENWVAWTEALQKKKAEGLEPTDTEKSRYRNPDIKKALIKETYGKCAYCESKLLHIAYGDIEHIMPKSKDIDKIFKWENLTLACDICNTNKGNVEDLIDPYIEDPETLIKFVGPLLLPALGSQKAWTTKQILDLNRIELVEKRKEKIENLYAHIKIFYEVGDKKQRQILKENFVKNEALAEKEFAAMARHFIRIELERIFSDDCTATVAP